MHEPTSDSEYSDTSEGTVSSSDSSVTSSSSDESINELELAKIGNDTLELPKGLCENPAIFKEFFSYATWSSLPANSQIYLKSKFLPHFSENNSRQQELTLEMLFGDKITRFGNSPLADFQKNLEEGNYRPDVLKLRESIAKSRRREARYQEYERISQMAKKLMMTREKLLRSAYNNGPGDELKVDTLIRSTPSLDETFTAVRARKRFHREMTHMSSQLGISDLSDLDEGGDESEPLTFPPNELLMVSTMARRSETVNRTRRQTNAPLNGKSLRRALIEHKRMKMAEPDRPEFETNDIRLRDIHTRTQIAAGVKKSFITGKTPGRKPKVKTETIVSEKEAAPPPLQMAPLPPAPPSTVALPESRKIMPNLSESDEDDVILDAITAQATPQILKSTPENNPYHGKIKPATLSDLDGIDMMHLPVDLDDSTDISMSVLSDFKLPAPAPTPAPVPALVSQSQARELMQDTHVSFFSLLRDIFCSTPNHRIQLEELKEKVSAWIVNPITALNDWYSQAENWLTLVQPAVNFLAGDYADQPEEFVPYVEFKSQLNIYQWIGAGRDTDTHLLSLCHYWMARKSEMSNKPTQKVPVVPSKPLELEDFMSTERMASPPPPRCTTSWIVCPVSPEEIEIFRAQERLRFENAHKAFTYRQHGYESVVGPVKGIYTQIFNLARAREHNMLIGDRPNFVTILTLVRDATARLPNGEGTRSDICELLRYSQYINPEASESVMQTIVSGALDRMHTETDPCVRYDTRRKIWIYLHRNRTEEEFEAIHQQNQGVGKHKKMQNRKVKTKVAKSESLLLPNQPPMHIVKATVITSSAQPVPLVMPALSSIQKSPPVTKFTQPPHPTPPQPKPVMKAELVPIKAVITSPAPPVRTIVVEDNQEVKKPQTLPPTNSTQIRVATPSGIQTVHVSVATPTPTVVTVPNTTPATPKRITKQILGAQQQQQGFVMPVNAPNAEQQSFKIISSVPNSNVVTQKVVKTNMINSRSGTVFQAPAMPQQQQAQPPQTKASKINLQPTQVAQKTIGNISITNNAPPPVGMTVKMPQQPMSNIQQKQMITNLINTPQAKRLITIQTQQQALNQQKNVIIQQTPQSQPRIISVSSAGLTAVTSAGSSGHVNTPQIIQIHTAGSQGTPGKFQTISNLTPQQQQKLIQSLKQQQQLKTVQGNKVQQSLIIKPSQTAFAQQKSSTNLSSASVTVCSAPVKTVTSIIQPQTNIIKTQVAPKTVTVVSQPQMITRVVQNQIISASGRPQSASNPIMAKVLTNQSGQIISLESLLQKQGVQPGTTLRVANPAKPGQTNIIQLASPTGSQIAQYAVVSQPRNIITMGNATRLVTTQAGVANTTMTSVNNAPPKEIKTINQTILNNQSGTNVISSNQIQTINAHQFMNAKVISKVPNQQGIRMINAANFNLSNLRGKPVIIASKAGQVHQTSTSVGNTSTQGQQQSVYIQNPTNVVIGGQTLKLQGNVISPANVQILNQQSGQRTATSQSQTMVLGNQIIKLQNPLKQSPQTIIASSLNSITSVANASSTTVASTNTGTVLVNSSGGVAQNLPRTVVLGSTGQTVRVHSPQVQMSSNGAVASASNMDHQQQPGQNQPIILGTTIKGTSLKATNPGQQRMVLAVQGGSQFILPANFQGGSINLKSLQGLKVVSLSQQQHQQQQNKNKTNPQK